MLLPSSQEACAECPLAAGPASLSQAAAASLPAQGLSQRPGGAATEGAWTNAPPKRIYKERTAAVKNGPFLSVTQGPLSRSPVVLMHHLLWPHEMPQGQLVRFWPPRGTSPKNPESYRWEHGPQGSQAGCETWSLTPGLFTHMHEKIHHDVTGFDVIYFVDCGFVLLH